MASFLWDPDLDTGIEELDYQHRRLFRNVSVLLEATRNKHTRVALTGFMVFLRKHVAEHFAYEEGLMLEHGYPEYLSHRLAHDEMRKTVDELEAEYRANGYSALVLIRLSTLMYDWFRRHIHGTDSRFTVWLRNKLSKSSG